MKDWTTSSGIADKNKKKETEELVEQLEAASLEDDEVVYKVTNVTVKKAKKGKAVKK